MNFGFCVVVGILVLMVQINEVQSKKKHPTGLKHPSAEELAHMKKHHHHPHRPRQKVPKRSDKHRALKQLNPATGLPVAFDWREETKCRSLTDVRSQQCGDCWAVSAAAVVSDRYCLFTGTDFIFSETYAATCTYTTATNQQNGCNGGYPNQVFANLYNTTGLPSGGDPSVVPAQPVGCLPSQDAYLNQSQADPSYFVCPTQCDDGSALDSIVGGTANILWNINADAGLYGSGMTMDQHINATMWEVYEHGPVAVLVAASSDAFQNYKGPDVYQSANPDNDPIDHAIRLIGWGNDNGTPFWWVANQWGPNWGIGGYMKILQGNDVWGVDGMISWPYPLEAFNAPDS